MSIKPSGNLRTRIPANRFPRFRNLKLIRLLLRFIILSLLIKAWRSLKRIVSPGRKSKIERKVMKMSKVKIMPEEEAQTGLPPMPGGEADAAQPGQSSPSIGSGSEPAVSEALAGDLIALPFDGAHLIWPDCQPLSDAEKERLAGPFARIMEKYGLGKIAKDEILLGFYLTACIYGRVKAVHDAKKRESIVDATNNSGQEGTR
jgi:hypothetical protein